MNLPLFDIEYLRVYPLMVYQVPDDQRHYNPVEFTNFSTAVEYALAVSRERQDFPQVIVDQKERLLAVAIYGAMGFCGDGLTLSHGLLTIFQEKGG